MENKTLAGHELYSKAQKSVETGKTISPGDI